MNNSSFLLLMIVLSMQASAQTTDFPIGFSGVPEAKLKGAVHTILTIEQRGEKVFSTIVEIYDLNGRLIESMSSNAGIEIHSGAMVRLGGKTFYSYDANGTLIKEKTFTPEGQYTGYETYIYDFKNRLTGTRIYNADGKETGYRTYTYSPEKREVVATWNFYPDGRKTSPMKNLLSYNEKGQWTKRTEFDFTAPEKEKGYITFEYDEQGNFIKETHCCEYNYSHRYSYKFDKQGNWIEMQNTYIQAGKDGRDEVDPDWMYTYRVITYYSDNNTKP